MDAPVKTPFSRRARKALETRRCVLDAAEALFTRDGYAATTMTAIADQADVAVQTLYAIFGNKRALLTELIDARVVGDDHAGSLPDREAWQAMEGETDSRRQIALFAAIATRIGSRSAAINEVLAAAAGADAEIAAVYEQQRQYRYRDERRLARSLARKGALRAGLSETQAADIIWAIATTHTYRALVGDRQWTADQYEHWLADLLARALLIERSG
ncbi:helix-turn-helix domain-containing protein [Candidatus Nephthysia bennettiae]|uniref:TetR/AcrR family transcriptional regulator n=1 Tax=Candidatus Nephthysia bennettiae TaxID=3127016 RepID=A0A934NC06_9BACT|nr:TetR/AcrR family transcriptional regulator [Candidatus Dormibacteraeota bacterium]